MTRELVSYLGQAKKYEVGSDSSTGINLVKASTDFLCVKFSLVFKLVFLFNIQELLEDFLYPASRIMVHYNKTGDLLSAVADPICATSASVLAALDLLVALSAGCVANMRLLTSMLTDMFFSGSLCTSFLVD